MSSSLAAVRVALVARKATFLTADTRIDDFLCSAALLEHSAQAVDDESCRETLDHFALRFALQLDPLGAVIPATPADAPRTAAFSTPLLTKDLSAYKDKCAADLDVEFLTFAKRLERLRKRAERAAAGAENACPVTGDEIERLSAELDLKIAKLLEVAHKTLPLRPPPRSGPVNPFHLPAKARKAHDLCTARAAAIRAAALAVAAGKPVSDRLAVDYPALADTAAPDWHTKAQAHLKEQTTAMRAIVRRHRKASARKRARQFAANMRTKRKQTYRKMEGESATQLTMLRDGGRILTTPDELLPAIARQYGAISAKVPCDTSIPAPWLPENPEQQAEPLDPFSPTPPVPPPGRERLYTSYDACFAEALESMQRHKSGGPDGLPAELLMFAPDSFRSILEHLFATCFLSAHCPASWKHSETIFLHKADDVATFTNFRPIGLVRTIYKAYGTVIDSMLHSHTEPAGSLSEAQEGFRKHRNCERQILTVESLIADAHANNRELHITYLDFKAAFTSISHERLEAMLKCAGVPEDALRVLADLYTDVSTSVRVPAGLSPAVAILRGVIQGDVISPIAFTLFLDPLLRWLDQGDCGYTPSSLACKIAVTGFADDLALTNTSAADAQRQLRKIKRFAAWTGMDLNVKKCAHTAARSPLRPRTVPGPDGATATVTDAVTWNGEPLPYLAPIQPYKYLGVHLSLDLSTSHQKAKLLEKIEKRILSIGACPELSNFNMHTIIRELLMPLVDYAMAAALLSPADVDDLENRLFRAYRQGLGLSASTSGAMLTLPKHLFGFGIMSLKQRYLDITTRTFKRILSTNSIPGQLGRAVLDRHLGMHGNLPASITAVDWHNLRCPWLRKCHLIYSMGGTLNIDAPAGFGGSPDDMLALIESVEDQPAPGAHLPHLRRLWALGLRSVEQLTIPGTNKLYELEDFTECFPTANNATRTSFSHVRRWLNRCTSIPNRHAVAGHHQTERQPSQSTPTGVSTRTGRAVRRPAHADDTTRDEATRMVRPPLPRAPLLPVQRPTWRDFSDKLTFIKTDNNPDHDCTPFESACCFSYGEPGSVDRRLLIYNTDGKLAGSIPWPQAETLYERFMHATLDEELCAELQPGTFAEELCLLLTRYHSGEITDSTGAVMNLKHHHALPARLMAALHVTFGVCTERFASPLNVLHRHYYSLYARDALFGARKDAYSCRWTGASVAHPEPETAAMTKAISWAIKSAAATDEPVITIIAVPAIESSAEFTGLLSHPLVQKITTIPRGRFRFTPACYTNLGKRGYIQHAHDAIHLLAVTNPAGLDSYLARFGGTNRLHAALVDIGRHARPNDTWTPTITAPVRRAAPATVSLAGPFARTPPESPHEATCRPEFELPLLVPSASDRELKWTGAIAYTDGSSKVNIAGAGVVFLLPAGEAGPPQSIRVHIGPGKALKAELTGLSTALVNSDPDEDTTAATDCLRMMCAVEKALCDPQSMVGHAEEPELRRAVKLLRARTGRFTLIKVKAHIGITGNELANEAAEAGRTNPGPTAPPAPAAAGQPDDDEVAPKISVIVSATGEPAVKADLEKIMSDAAVAEIKAIEHDRAAREAAREAAIAAGEDADPVEGQSIVSRWVSASESDYVAPTAYGFDKARLAAMPSRTMNRIRMQQRPHNFGQICKALGCNAKVVNIVHGRGACRNLEIRGLITDCSNQSVHIVADTARSDDGTCVLLVNAGVKYGNMREDYTIPGWALPHIRGRPGHRPFPDKPDTVLIRGWAGGPTPPTNAKLTPGYNTPVVTFVIVEHKMANDMYLSDARNEKRSIYVELVKELLAAGWAVEFCTQITDVSTWYRKYRVFDESEDTPATGPAVDETANDDSDVESSSSDNDDVDAAPGSQAQDSQEPSQRSQPRARARARAPLRVFDLEDGEPHAFPIHTIIVGHAGSQLDSNTDAFLALGIPQAKHKDLLLALSVNAVQRTHHSLVHYKRLCRGVAPARAGAPAAGVG